MRADTYYGDRVRTYDADRCHSLRWAREQIAVHDFVTDGPVLDVPLGTGRYCEIYGAKGLKVSGVDISGDMLKAAKARYRWLDARQGSIFDLPFAEQEFGTAVCTRLLDWLSPEDMEKAVRELRRVAKSIVLTIRHGEPGYRVNWTHELACLYRAVDGLFIGARRVTEETEDGVEEILKLRPATFGDVLAQIDFPGATFCNPEDELQRLVDQWSGTYWSGFLPVNRGNVTVEATYIAGRDLWLSIERMARHIESYVTDEPSRHEGQAVLLLEYGTDRIVLDGRRRINKWKDSEDLYPALVLRRVW